ncbi:MAG: hypothetical protein ACP5G6_08750 [Conexivisphaera sp.]|jgi:trimethylamine-N-oxide reductase (cytochrome c)
MHTVGFEKWADYVMGKEDGIPKTPEWAERITGVPAREIRAVSYLSLTNIVIGVIAIALGVLYSHI